MNNTKLLIVYFFVFLQFGSFGQNSLSEKDIVFFKKYEDSLKKLQKDVFFSKSDSLKSRANKKFLELWEEILLNKISFEYPFDSLKEVARLSSPDKKFRIINWNISKDNDATQMYYGYIQVLNPKTNDYDLYHLIDKSGSIKNPETYLGDNNKWFGMLYFKLIPCDGYYILLAWDGNDRLTRRKFIDVLSFKPSGEPVFGKDVFKMPKKNPKRIMFEYSAEVVMSLKYNEEKKLIVFDHLAPKDPIAEGQYQFYGPDFSTDGFRYIKGKWKYEEDLDSKNTKNKNDNVKRNKDKKDKPIYIPK
ncbi:MAG TPA: hypothetical protein VNX68_05325 [Nitrosopumilaceae archaeon]|jgi:hypothetical protein|nr:hypothetical protein [Nitrosopumilaceae archaeon]